MEDKRAHERVDGLEKIVSKHLQDHAKFESALLENTMMTKKIAENTAELVTLVKGARSVRTFAVWFAPIAVAMASIIAWWEAHK